MTDKKYYWVYMLYCRNGNYYTGYTVDLIKRYQAHRDRSGSKYTRSFPPLYLVQCWRIQGRALAMKIERRIKKLSRGEKEKIIASPGSLFEID